MKTRAKRHEFLDKFVRKMAESALDKRTYIPFWALNIVWRFLDKQGTRILDIGCGPGKSMRALKKRMKLFSVGIDIYRPYLEECKAKGTHNESVLCDVRVLPFKTKSFDIALCLEVVEHLEKKDGLRLIDEMERIARKQVILSTPVGVCKQEGHGGNPYEEHRSYWKPSELRGRDYKVRGCGLRCMMSNELLSTSRLPGFLRPLRHLMWVLAGPFVYFLPKMAGDMVCIKNLESGE